VQARAPWASRSPIPRSGARIVGIESRLRHHARAHTGAADDGNWFARLQVGWFRLRNGEQALLYLTDTSRAVYVPTTAGYSVLLSPQEPDEFLAAVRNIGGQR
jgi:hypothetical protein